MTRTQCIDMISEAYRQFVPAEALPVSIGEDTSLFGGDSPLDSAGLVSLVIDVEQQLNESSGTAILIADDRAMSQTRSPFRTIGSLADYIQTLLAETRD